MTRPDKDRMKIGAVLALFCALSLWATCAWSASVTMDAALLVTL